MSEKVTFRQRWNNADTIANPLEILALNRSIFLAYYSAALRFLQIF